MKQLCGVLCAFLLAFVLLVGLVSLFDHDPVFSPKQDRDLAEMLPLSFAGLLDGSWFDGLQAYYADHFPGREDLLDLYFTLDGSAGPAETTAPAE